MLIRYKLIFKSQLIKILIAICILSSSKQMLQLNYQQTSLISELAETLPRIYLHIHSCIHFCVSCPHTFLDFASPFSTFTYTPTPPFAASTYSTMAVVPARRDAGRFRKRKSGPNVHIQNYGNLCIGVATGMKKGHSIDRGQMFSQEKDRMGFGGAGGGPSESSGSDASGARPKGYGVRIATAAPQHSTSREALAHAIVRGFGVGAARKLPEFLERRASPCNATAENMVGIKEVLTCVPCSLFRCCWHSAAFLSRFALVILS